MKKIVVADDNEVWLNQLIDALKIIEELEIVGSANDGEEELEYIKKFSPDIVITDIEMPNMTGVEVIEKVKEFEKVPEFIVVTGGASSDIMQQLYKLPVADICMKPITTEKIITKIQRIIEEEKNDSIIDEEKNMIPIEKVSIWQRIKRFFTKKYSK